MLMHFAIHVGVCVCVDVRVDLWVDFGRASLGQEKLLLLGHVLLVSKGSHVLLIAGRQRTWGPVPGGLATWTGQSLAGVSCAWGALLLGLAQPQEDCAKDEDHPSRDANDDGPGQAGGHDSGNGVVVGAGVCTGDKHMHLDSSSRAKPAHTWKQRCGELHIFS